MSWEPVIRSISAEVTARPRRSGPAALQRTSTARRSGSGAREFYGFWGHLGPDPRIRAGKDECASSPWRSRARTPKIRALTLERSMLSPHMRRRAVESSARTRIWVARGRVCEKNIPAEMRGAPERRAEGTREEGNLLADWARPEAERAEVSSAVHQEDMVEVLICVATRRASAAKSDIRGARNVGFSPLVVVKRRGT